MTIPGYRLLSRGLIATAAVAGVLACAAAPVSAASGAQTGTCTASTTHRAAPGVGLTRTDAAGTAGSVTLLQKTKTTLQVQSVTANSGWTSTVVTPSGVRVHVGFQMKGTPASQVRFYARLNSAGTTLTVIVETCS